MVRKSCPLLVQRDAKPSYVTDGATWTRTYRSRMEGCIGQKCAAFCVEKGFRGYCKQFETYLDVYDDVEECGDG